jgi:tetratricopeptide (TPR) repeat protein
LASQKEKYLSSAQKWIQKGQLDRAIKDYEQIVAMDPKDVRHRQKLAELLARCNRNEDAIREYENIARFYEDNGFYLKAIAVYKQIQKLDSGNIEISLTLAALNEKQGLIGNTLSEYKYVFDYYEKEGNTAEACKILKKMHAVDPDNIDIQLKLAETCFAAGQADEAYQEYTRAALLLKNRGNEVVFDKVCNRIQSLFPEKKEFILDLLEEQIKSGMVADVIPRLKQMLEDDDNNHKVLTLYAEACKKNGDRGGRRYACEKLLQYFPTDASSKEGLIECTVEEGNPEDSLKTIDLYASDLIAAGLFSSLEKFYTTLQSHTPYDTRILEGLKTLYETTGDMAKLADVQVSLKILSGDSPAKESEPTADVVVNTTENTPSTVELSGDMELDFPWDEGIDLSISPDEADDTSKAYILNTEDMGTSPDFMESGEEIPIAGSDELSEKDFVVEELVEEPGKTGQFPDLLHIDLDDALLEVEFEEPAELEEVKEVVQLEPVLEEEKSEPGGDWLSMDVSPETVVHAGKNEVAEVSSDDNALMGAEEYSLESELGEPEIGLGEQLDKDDAETRFNLGIAYKEMGLYEEAMKEFTAAAANPLRTVDCLILQGICLGEMGDMRKAEEVLTHGIDIFKQEPEKSLNMKYELGLLYEASGRNEDALRVFRDVFTASPGFRDTVGKIAKLHGSGDLPDFSDIDELDFKLERMK